ncbi:hypothetical protein VP01_515g13 [Puccinia sorghi]|uniref:2-amino-4-hydroxy-6-hydroxymethyldihydropteridine diphosphokinase n=1 Tax=Puccinia sorghi TaxID=27349 RepID=A0A0L6ULP1_9BASI|nr:hypothetical protein VP01_515g13 [Puccinia sorghi]
MVFLSPPSFPQELLKLIKQIEADQSRIPQNVPQNSPRQINIDILLYNLDIIRQHDLVIPQAGILERQFVLDPLTEFIDKTCNIVLSRFLIFSLTDSVDQPNSIKLIFSKALKSVKMLLANLLGDTADTGHVRRLHQISAAGRRTLDLTSLTYLMTPCGTRSSMSLRVPMSWTLGNADLAWGRRRARSNGDRTDDAGDWDPVAPPGGLPNQHRHVSCSHQGWGNDFQSLGEADPDMLATVTLLDVSYVLMRMRKNPRTMGQLTSYRFPCWRAQRACGQGQTGIKHWSLIVDPGFGFAKDFAGNCCLLEGLGELRKQRRTVACYPASRILSACLANSFWPASSTSCSRQQRQPASPPWPQQTSAPDHHCYQP